VLRDDPRYDDDELLSTWKELLSQILEDQSDPACTDCMETRLQPSIGRGRKTMIRFSGLTRRQLPLGAVTA